MTSYHFIKDGHTYSILGKNRFEAQFDLEMRFHLSLKGAAFEERDKHNKVTRRGICR